MKKHYVSMFIILSLAFLYSSTLLMAAIDEKDALKAATEIEAVLNKEKKGYFDKDFEVIASTWVQKASSVKIFMSAKGETYLNGWDKIAEFSKKELAADYSEYKNRSVEFSDFNYNIQEKTAWVIFKASWKWTYKGQLQTLRQTRINAFEKVDGKWKITLMAIYNVPTE
jgi:hypothetical protein